MHAVIITKATSFSVTVISGEPARIVIAGMPEIDGESMAEKRICLMDKFNHIRKILLQEPRGIWITYWKS